MRRGVGCPKVASQVGLLLVLAILLGVAPALADGYKDGLDALEAGQWAAAEQHFLAAIEENPNARKRLFARPYMPYYHLGIARAEQGECREALEAFTEAEHQGIVQNQAEEYADLQRRQTACRRQIQRQAEREQAMAVAEQALEIAREAAQGVASLRRAPDLARRWSQGEPSLADREARARERLEEATRRLDAFRRGQGDLGILEEATDAARQAREDFDALEAEARDLRGAVQESRQELLAQVDAAAAEARRALRGSEDLAPYPPAITARRREIVRLLNARESLSPTAPLNDLGSLRDGLDRAAQRLRNEAAGPPGELQAAAEALFGGRYGQVLEMLEEQTYPSRRANAHVHLLRAAARYYLYESGGRRDESLLEAARRDAVVGRRLDASLTLPQRAFPPGFRTLWEEAEGEEEASP